MTFKLLFCGKGVEQVTKVPRVQAVIIHALPITASVTGKPIPPPNYIQGITRL